MVGGVAVANRCRLRRGFGSFEQGPDLWRGRSPLLGTFPALSASEEEAGEGRCRRLSSKACATTSGSEAAGDFAAKRPGFLRFRAWRAGDRRGFALPAGRAFPPSCLELVQLRRGAASPGSAVRRACILCVGRVAVPTTTRAAPRGTAVALLFCIGRMGRRCGTNLRRAGVSFPDGIA